MELDRDLGFSRGHQGRQGHRPHDDNDDGEEDDEVEDKDKDDDDNKDDNNDKGISALGLDRDLRFSWGRQRHRPDDDDVDEEEDDEGEDNDKNDDNNKDDNNDKGISALGLDGDLGFSRVWVLWLSWYYYYITSQKIYQTKHHATS